jgi:hypothetical protein
LGGDQESLEAAAERSVESADLDELIVERRLDRSQGLFFARYYLEFSIKARLLEIEASVQGARKPCLRTGAE